MESLIVPRAELDIEEPWATPAVCTPVRLRRVVDAAAPRLSTSLAVWYDDEFLDVLFSSSDDHIESTHLEHDAPLYTEDVVEVFLAPGEAGRYFEIEVSPRGTVFDARIDSPDGVRATMRADPDWDCQGLMAAVRRVTESSGAMSVDTVVRIPFAGLARPRPVQGEAWRANFFRIDRHPRLGDEYSAWQPTWKVPPDFHVVAAFGRLEFR
jgi:Carbohydrate-binding family 9